MGRSSMRFSPVSLVVAGERAAKVVRNRMVVPARLIEISLGGHFMRPPVPETTKAQFSCLTGTPNCSRAKRMYFVSSLNRGLRNVEMPSASAAIKSARLV